MDLIFFIDLGRFYMISTIWHSDRIDLGIFGELGLVNLSGFVCFFVDSSCLGGSGRISIDSLGFV